MKASDVQLKITQRKSLIGAQPSQRATVRALGLRRIRHSVLKDSNPVILGMIEKVRHLVAVEEIK